LGALLQHRFGERPYGREQDGEHTEVKRQMHRGEVDDHVAARLRLDARM
jgi:hypothetical protein